MVNESITLEELLDIQTRIDRLKEEMENLKEKKTRMINRFNASLLRRMERTLKRFLVNAQEYYGCQEFDISDADIRIETGEYEDCNACGYEGELVYHAYGLTLDEQSGKVFVLFSESCGPNYNWGSHREKFSETRLSTIKQISEYLAQKYGVGLKDAAGKILFSGDQDYYRRRIDLLSETILIPPDAEKVKRRAYENFPLLKKVIISDGVTGIGSYAFSGCKALQEIDIPDSVSVIGDHAFEDCERLKEIRLPIGLSSVEWSSFENCSRLSSVILPFSVTEIRDQAFSGCSSLKEIRLPESLAEIGSCAFRGCSSLKEIFIPSHVKKIGFRDYSSAFPGCSKLEEMVVSPDNPSFDSRGGCNAIIETASNTLIAGCRNTVIPDSVTRIGPSAFEGCSCPEQLFVPDSVTEIGRDAFKGCYGLRVIYVPVGTDLTDACLPTGVQVFERAENSEDNAEIDVQVSGHEGLITMRVPDSRTRIGDSALCNCLGLRSIHIPESVTEIGREAFFGCAGMKTIYIPGNVLAIGNGAFAHTGFIGMTVSPDNPRYDSREDCNAVIDSDSNTLIAGCKKTVIPDGVTQIGTGAFFECLGLTEIHIPDSVTEIGDQAFRGCSELKEIDIPEGVTRIGDYAFCGCASIRHLQIPRSVTEIGEYALKHCTGLLSILAPKGLDLKAARVPRGVRVRRHPKKTDV